MKTVYTIAGVYEDVFGGFERVDKYGDTSWDSQDTLLWALQKFCVGRHTTVTIEVDDAAVKGELDHA